VIALPERVIGIGRNGRSAWPESAPSEAARECERFLYVAQLAYEKVAGGEIPRKDLSRPREPVGSPWQEDDLPKLLPRIAQTMLAAP
jgi:hypothetical protein